MKHIFTIWVCLLGCFSNVFSQREDIDPDKSLNFRKGVRQLRNHHYYKALPYLLEALNEHATDALRLFYVGKAYYEIHEEAKAYEYLDRAYQKRPTAHPHVPMYAARIYHRYGKYELALDAYEKALPKAESDEDKKFIKLQMQQCSTAIQWIQANPNYSYPLIENLGPHLNTRFSEYVPIFNGKMNQVMYTSRRPRKPKQKHQGQFYNDDVFEDVYFAKNVNGIWHRTQTAKRNIPSRKHDANIISNKTFTELYLYRSVKRLGDIYYSKYENGKWKKPTLLLGEVNTQYAERHISIAPNGKFAYFSSDRPGGKGGLDIYYVKKAGENTWTGAKKININTPYDEDAPFFDGEYLYFSSRRPDGFGGYDIYKAKMIDEVTFEEPINLGMPINSGGDDIYYIYHADSNKAMFSSNRAGGYGLMDNYIIDFNQVFENTDGQISCDSLLALLDELNQKIKDLETQSPNTETNLIDTEGATIVLSGNIVDNVTDEPITKATVKLIDPKNNQVIQEMKVSHPNANYKFSIVSGKRYKIVVESPEHLKFAEDFVVPITNKKDAHIKIVPMQKANSIRSIVLGWQFFKYDNYNLVLEKVDELDNLAAIMKTNPDINIKLIGHTDGDGSHSYNDNLSLKRANAVKEYLVKKGVEPNRIATEGKGKREPLYDNTSRFKKWNRRVEVYVVE